MNKILDIFDDKYFIRLKDEFENMPEFVKKAEFNREDKSNISDWGLCLIDEKGDYDYKYPINSKSNTYLSDFYFKKTASFLPPTAKKIAEFYIHRAKEHYGLLNDETEKIAYLEEPKNNMFCVLDAERDYANEFLKIANKQINNSNKKDEDFALVKVSNLNKKRLFPINNKELVKQASEYFEKNYIKLSVKDRNIFSKNVMKKIAEFKMNNFYDNVLLYSGKAQLKDEKLIKQAFENRIYHCGDYETKKCYTDFFNGMSEHKQEVLPNILFEIDKQAGYVNIYDRVFDDPYKTLFTTEIKSDSIDTKNGENIYAQDIKKIASLGKLNNVFDNNLIKNLTLDTERTYNTLNNTEKEIIKTKL